jgi:8-oxo-dGTP pyrophosphatase MutT (NUDIX family)
MTPERTAYYRDLPRSYLGASALVTDEAGNVLVVEPTYKPFWEVPGGMVEAGEDPRTACLREVREEIGLDIDLGPLLVMMHATLPPPRGDSIMFVYDGGTLEQPRRITLDPTELASYRFVAPAELATVLSPRLAKRMEMALRARKSGRVVELVGGERLAG